MLNLMSPTKQADDNKGAKRRQWQGTKNLGRNLSSPLANEYAYYSYTNTFLHFLKEQFTFKKKTFFG